MKKTSRGYAPMPDFCDILYKALEDHSVDLPSYTLHKLENPIDSSNAIPQDWGRIALEIERAYGGYDGFVVLHGTDTMAYTAAAVSYMLKGVHKPVIITGSQIPFGELRSDALKNLSTSMLLAASDEIKEVAIYFDDQLFRGNRAIKVSGNRFDAFESPNYPELARSGIQIGLNRAALLRPAGAEQFRIPQYDAQILSAQFSPGMPSRSIQVLLELEPQAFILRCYGAGNAPDHDPFLYELLDQADTKGVVLVATAQAVSGSSVQIGTYASSARLAEVGVIGAQDMTFEASYAKLHYLLSSGLRSDAIKSAFLADISGEISNTSN
jgi:L-asparaginase